MKKISLVALMVSVGVLTACGGSNKAESAVDATKNAAGAAATATTNAVGTAADATKDAATATVNKAVEAVRTAKP